MSSLVDHFDALVKLDLKPVPLRSGSKAPVYKSWPKNWNENLTRYYFSKNNKANIGILLGEIIDVEGDTPEANAVISKLIGDYRHPSYKSSRSTHHLFLNPFPDLTIWKFEGIEFRGYGHQSVVPPSTHNGVEYKWIDTDSFPIPPLPKSLSDFYLSRVNTSKKAKRLPKGCFKPICCDCNKKVTIHKKRYELEVESFAEIGIEKWICRSCRKVDLRSSCRKIRSRKRRRRKQEA